MARCLVSDDKGRTQLRFLSSDGNEDPMVVGRTLCCAGGGGGGGAAVALLPGVPAVAAAAVTATVRPCLLNNTNVAELRS